MMEHLLPYNIPWTRDRYMRSMIRCCQEVRSWTDYILGTDFRLLQNMVLRDPRQNTYHYLVLGCLCGVTQRKHQRYLRSHTRTTLYPPKWVSHEIFLFVSLRQVVPKNQRESVCAPPGYQRIYGSS